MAAKMTIKNVIEAAYRHAPPPFRACPKDIRQRSMFTRRRPIWHPLSAALTIATALATLLAGLGRAEEWTLVLDDGRMLTGIYAQVAGVAESPLAPKIQAGEVPVTPIIIVDDGLRRTFVHSRRVRNRLPVETGRDVRIPVWQHVADRGAGVGRLGAPGKVEPFDEFGRRIYEIRTSEGVLSIVQGITQITPLYAKVQSLRGDMRPIVWESRVSTSSLPRETLSRILANAIPQNDIDKRLQAVRLYMQAERYLDAGNELAQIVKDFPERKDLAELVRQLRQLAARALLAEVQLRANAGQHQIAQLTLLTLSKFPGDSVDGETLQEVRERLEKYALDAKRRESIINQLKAEIAKIGDENGRRLAEEFAVEIATEVNEDAIARLTSFERLASDASMTPEQKVALAISGWIIGTAKATDKFQAAISMAEVRDHVRQYLRDPVAANRGRILSELRDLAGASVENVAQILKLLKPPLGVPPGAQRGPRTFELTVPGLAGQGGVRYVLELPPEYDPLQHYPLIVALSDLGAPPSSMLDFWAGAANPETGERMGQAARHGYIVLAVDWQQPDQLNYEYSAAEHHAVLSSLRDASRRFAIDPDRVFLAGHGTGADAAFDLGLSHPDLWAGVLPIAGRAERYCTRYRPNGEMVRWYVVDGELDGDNMQNNATVLDGWMLRPNVDVTVVEYLGRGHEPFGDELQRMFDWMGRDRRRKMPEKFEFLTMRPWDNFFWWVEVEGLPERSMVMPALWPPATGVRPYPFSSELTASGKLRVTAHNSERVTVWLSPELVKFGEPIVVELNNKPMSRERMIQPDLGVLLEDARTRADRQHPFWAKLTAP
jgi:predicted esterase